MIEIQSYTKYHRDLLGLFEKEIRSSINKAGAYIPFVASVVLKYEELILSHENFIKELKKFNRSCIDKDNDNDFEYAEGEDNPDLSCDQCNAMMIQQVYCHETGCPNSRKVKIDGKWGTPETNDESNEE